MNEVSETMQNATIEIFNLPYGCQMHKHYYYSQHGEIDFSDIRYSIIQVDQDIDKHIYVSECYSYEQAMVMFLTQIQAQRLGQFDGLVIWICKLLDIGLRFSPVKIGN